MKLMREPLVHFLLLGAGLFLLFGWVADDEGDRPDHIVVSSGQIEQLVATWTRTWQRPPTQQELDGLIEDYIRGEVYYREAVAMGLDRDDTIVRRRMRQKLEFFTDDLVDSAGPSEEQLAAFYHENADVFRVPGRIAFRQIYIDRDRRGERALDDALALLARLSSGDEADLDRTAAGDSLLLPAEVGPSSRDEIARQFGRAFAESVFELPVGRWSGPVESGYGLHLVRIERRAEAALPSLDALRAEVEREWRAGRRKQAAEAFYQSLRERYEIRIESPSADGEGTGGGGAESRG